MKKSQTKKTAPKEYQGVWRWVAAALSISVLGSLFFTLSYIVADTIPAFFALSLPVVGIFISFAIAFVVLGRFGLWKYALATAALCLLIILLALPIAGHLAGIVFPLQIPITADVWLSGTTLLIFPAVFLVVAGTAGVASAVIHRSPFRLLTAYLLTVAISLAVILL